MKPLAVLFSLLLIARASFAQDVAGTPLTAKLLAGYPPAAAFFVNEYKPTHLQYTSLATGMDSLNIMIGTFQTEQARGYYSLIRFRKSVLFRTFNLRATDSAHLRADQVDLKFNDESLLVSAQLQHDLRTDELRYSWISPAGPSQKVSLQPISRLRQNTPMPNFEVQALDGTRVSLADFKGKYLVLNWWATSCGPCIAEMPVLNQVVEKYKSRSDVAFLAVAGEEKEKLEGFLAKRPFAYKQTYSKAAAAIFGESYPVHIIINPQGVITYYGTGVKTKIVKGKLDLEEKQAIERALEQQLAN